MVRHLSPYLLKHVDIILPPQYFRGSTKLPPELHLMMAVLEDAIDCITKYRSATDREGRRIFDEEQRWLFSEDSHWLYSFGSMCDVLDLDAEAVRRSLGFGSMRSEQAPRVGRARGDHSAEYRREPDGAVSQELR